MRVAIGSDHAGYEFKEQVKAILEAMGHEVTDKGTFSQESVDYPDYGLQVAQAVASNEVDRGIAICWTGNGMAMVTNKVDRVRAGLALNPEMAQLTRQHNDANVLILAQKYTPKEDLEEILKFFLETAFEGGRHARRVEKLMSAEGNGKIEPSI